MELYDTCSEDEIVATFLQAEIESAQFGPRIARIAAELGVPVRDLTHPVLGSADAAAVRARVLAKWRGWKQNDSFLRGFPDHLSWHDAELTPDDVPNLRYPTAKPWGVISGETFAPTVAIARIRQGLLGSDDPVVAGTVGAIGAIVERLEGGATVPMVIAVGAPGDPRIVLVEGSKRVTAFAMNGFPDRLPIYYGEAELDALRGWAFMPER